MGFLDIILGLLLIWGLWKGFKNGLFVELASIIAIIAGIYGAIHFSYIAADYLSEDMDWNEKYIGPAAFIITFIAIIAGVHLAGKLLTKIADFALLGIVNKIAGAGFGALKMALIVGAVLVFFERVNATANLVEKEKFKSSVLYGPVKEIGTFVFDYILKTDVQQMPKRKKTAKKVF